MIRSINTNKDVPCYYREVTLKEIREKKYLKSNGWEFDWDIPIGMGFMVYGLVTEEFPEDVQGLIAVKANTHPEFLCVFLEIVESAPTNKKVHPNRRYKGVGIDLIAFACQYSFDNNCDGYVKLTSKTSKFDFYDKLKFDRYGQDCTMHTKYALSLAKKHFPGGVLWWKI